MFNAHLKVNLKKPGDAQTMIYLKSIFTQYLHIFFYHIKI